ncbi:MAG: hypothetical protein M1816_002016 [Peltula sp. TS41687]|nr:MAG: hypothetical protein M1816_002016 [Peltula sp. TS41687]
MANMEVGAKNHQVRIDTPDSSSAYNETENLSRPLLRVEAKKGGNPFYMDGFLMPGTLGDHHLDPGYRSSGTVFELDEDVKSVREDDSLRVHDEEGQSERARLSSIYDRTGSPSVLPEDDEDDQSSTNLSMQAERILASAKRKLDKMEGNLSRARHSLIMSPTPSPLSSLNNSPHSSMRRRSPPSGNPYLRLQDRTSLDSDHDLQFPSSTRSSNSDHSRIVSETSVPTSVFGRQELNQNEQDSLHTSGEYDNSFHFGPHIGHQALGTRGETDAGNVMAQPTRSFRQRQVGPRDYFNPFRIHNRSSPTSYSAALKPLDERDTSSTVDSSMDGVSVTESYLSSNSQGFVQSNGLTRSRSAMPIREVRDQMEDLKGRISNLQQRAKADSLKRRSLQGLRTDNQFTTAEQWYRAVDEGKEDDESGREEGWKPSSDSDKGASDQVRNSQTKSETLLNDVENISTVEDNDTIPEENPAEGTGKMQGTTEDHHKGEYIPETNEETEEDQGSDAETTEDEAEYYEAPVSMGERHEDRADAFDYEHFFLHSALGNYSRGDTSRRDSYISNDSTTSVETARPEPEPEQSRDETPDAKGRPPMWIHDGTVSTESLVTVGTFATAMEGDGEEYDWGGDSVKFEKATPVMTLPGSFPNTSVDTLTLRDGDGWNERDDDVQEQDILVDGATAVESGHHSSHASWPLPDTDQASTAYESLSLLVSALQMPVESLHLPSGPKSIPALSAEDRALVQQVLDNLGKACERLQESLNDPSSDDQDGDLLRARLLNAGRILEGS